MLEKQVKALRKKVRHALHEGKPIVVVGWMDQNHNLFTRGISRKKVHFCDAHVHDVGSPGLVLYTKYVSHKSTQRINNGHKTHKVVLEIREIREILESCGDLLRSSAHDSHSPANPHYVEELTAAEIDDDVLDFITEPRRFTLDTFDCFSKRFTEEAQKSPRDGYVSTHVLSVIRTECKVDLTTQQLAKAGWIVGEVTEGKTRIGWYTAGEKLKDRMASQSFEPENPYERALMLIAQEAELLVQKEALERQLARIDVAKRVIKQLEELSLEL